MPLKRKIPNPKCDTCKKIFNFSMSHSPNWQGNGCATLVIKKFLYGYYGSNTVDGDVWEFMKRPQYVKNGVICDDCIQTLIENNNIKLKSSNNWY